MGVASVMRLIEDSKVKTNGVNGNGVHVDDSDSEEEVEEPEPVSGTLVLRVISEPPSPSVSRKASVRRDQPPAFLTEDRPEQYLQVQVQRSTSSSSLSGSRHESRSRPSSTTPSFYVTEADTSTRLERIRSHEGFSSRDSSCSPTPSLYSMDVDLHRPNGVNSVEFMQRVTDQTKLIQQGLKTLRGEVDNPLRVLDIGQEAIVLSGLNRSASDSLRNIKNLYDETKCLKSYLEKLEARVHYDLSVRHKTPYSPPWYRRLLFLGGLLGTGLWLWRRQDPQGFEGQLTRLAETGRSGLETLVEFFTSERGPGQVAVTLQ